MGTVLHPKGNISELLLEQGFAKIVDWSFGNVTIGRDKLRAAENAAKAKKLRLWTDFKETAKTIIADQDFSCVVEEVQSGECLLVNHNNISKKIFLARYFLLTLNTQSSPSELSHNVAFLKAC